MQKIMSLINSFSPIVWLGLHRKYSGIRSALFFPAKEMLTLVTTLYHKAVTSGLQTCILTQTTGSQPDRRNTKMPQTGGYSLISRSL